MKPKKKRFSLLRQNQIKFCSKRCWKEQPFTGKHLCQSLFFNEVTVLRPATLSKKRLWHRCFPVNFAKFLRATFLQNTSGRLLLFHLAKFVELQINSSSFERMSIFCVSRQLKSYHVLGVSQCAWVLISGYLSWIMCSRIALRLAAFSQKCLSLRTCPSIYVMVRSVLISHRHQLKLCDYYAPIRSFIWPFFMTARHFEN